MPAALLLLAALQGEITFEITNLPVHGDRQTTLTYDLNGDGRTDLLNVSVHEETRWGSAHYQRKDGSFDPKPDRVIRFDDRAAALLFGDVDGTEAVEVLFLADDGVYFYPSPGPAIQHEARKLLHTATFFTAGSRDTLPVWHYREDLDGNGLADLIIPTDEGYKIYFQTERGRFGRISRLEADVPPERRAVQVVGFAQTQRLRATTFTFEKRIPRLLLNDVDGDRRNDIVIMVDDRLTVYFMTEQGTYTRQRRETRIVRTLRPPDRPGTIEVSGVWFQDLNDDSKPELVVTKIEGQLGLVDSLQTNIYIHRGNGTAAFTPDHTVMIPGVSPYPTFVDLNADSKLDLYATYVTTGFLKKALEMKIFGDMEISTGFWRSAGGRFTEPDHTHSVLVPIKDLEEKRSRSVPIVYLSDDLTGDGRPDMVMVTPEPALKIHNNRIRGRDPLRINFEPRPRREYPLEIFPRWVSFRDLNGDGIADLQLQSAHNLGLALSRKPK